MQNKLKWCFTIKDGAALDTPNPIISKSFLELSKDTLMVAETVIETGEAVWSTSMIYYAQYYAVYAFLSRLGIRCENHVCSIKIAAFLLGDEIVSEIENSRKRRINAQYYLKTENIESIRKRFSAAKVTVTSIESIISSLTENKIDDYLSKLKSEIKTETN